MIGSLSRILGSRHRTTTNNLIPFGAWLKRRRKELGLTQPDLAEQISCSLETIEKIEAGKRRPSKQIAALIAECLDIPPDERIEFAVYARMELSATLITPKYGSPQLNGNGHAPWRRLHERPNNLPAQPNPFIGREKEIEEAGTLLRRPGVRLLTMTGAPGIGKTRLALRVAETLNGDFEDGTFLVPLAPIGDTDLVPSTIARALGVHEAGNRPMIEILKDYLQSKRLFLLLDNFEQVVEAAIQVSDLLASAPGLKILVTSRQPLNVSSEYDFQVPPLSLPTAEHSWRAEDLEAYEAVVLFYERASAARRGFSLMDGNAQTVAEICLQLDGLPLAIELAATHIRALSPQELLTRLQSRLNLLDRAALDFPPRHQTLRNAIAWSYDLLDNEEQKLCRRLSIFVGGCTPEAADAVCGAGGDLRIALLHGTSSLVEKNLLREDTGGDGEVRFWMLETIREYGLERLAQAGEMSSLRREHARYSLRMAEEAELQLRGPHQITWLNRLEREHDNLRAALRWARESLAEADKEIGLRLVGALHWFWFVRGYLNEGREQSDSMLSAADRAGASNSTGARSKAIFGAGFLAWQLGDYSSARRLHAESLAIRRELNDQHGIAWSLTGLGAVARHQGSYAEARALHHESLAMFRELGDKLGIASALNNLGSIAFEQEDYATGRSIYDESLPMWRELGDDMGIASALHNMGSVALDQADYATARLLFEENLSRAARLGHDWLVSMTVHNLGLLAQAQGDNTAARRHLEESLAIERKLGRKLGVGASLIKLADLSQEEGDFTEARTLYREGLTIWWEIGYKLGLEQCLESLGRLAAAEDRIATAAQFWGAAEIMRETENLSITLADLPLYHRSISVARDHIEEAIWEANWAIGRSMTMDEIIAYALEETDRKQLVAS